MPLPVPEYLNVNYICESASRLLFLSMHWARSIPAFQTLRRVRFPFTVTQSRSAFSSVPLTVTFDLPSGQDNDINLMKACWNELFALGLAQCSSVMNVGTILSAIINHLQTSLQEGRRARLLFACVAERLTRHPRE